jgi:hypothetical protein
MGEIIRKDATVSPVGESEFHVLLSTPHTDRDGEQLHLGEWKTPLPQSIPFSADHDMTSNGIVGSGTPALTARGLEVYGRWAETERARHVRGLVNSGHLTHTSVEFMTHRDTKSGNASRELIGGSFVYTPSNTRARVLSSKAFTSFMEAMASTKAPDSQPMSEPADLLQAIHDASSLLGAQCTQEPAPDEADGSAEGANKDANEATLNAQLDAFRIRLSALHD